MIWIVVTIHLLLSLGLLWAAWQAWKLKLVLAAMVNKIDGWTEASRLGLFASAPAILKAQKGANLAQDKYQALLPQLQRIRLVLSLFNRMRSILGSLSFKFKKQSSKPQVKKSYRSDRHGERRR